MAELNRMSHRAVESKDEEHGEELNKTHSQSNELSLIKRSYRRSLTSVSEQDRHNDDSHQSQPFILTYGFFAVMGGLLLTLVECTTVSQFSL